MEFGSQRKRVSLLPRLLEDGIPLPLWLFQAELRDAPIARRRERGETPRSGRGKTPVDAHSRRDAGRRGARWLLIPSCRWRSGLVSLALSAGGCAGWWDEVSSRDFHFKDVFKKAPDPMWVIQNSPDGDKKAKALRSLKEPATHGGTQQEQDTVVQVLAWTAANDPQAICRMAAIDTLRHFRDPRAVEALKDAYYRADGVSSAGNRAPRDPAQNGFPQDTASIIRTGVLAALGDTGQPAAVDLLVKALLEPPVEGNEIEKQQKQDERTAAARALGHFPQYQSTEALVTVMRSTPDVALQHRAGEALVKITGKDLPPEPQVWDDFLHNPANKDALAGNGVFDKFLHLFSAPTEQASEVGGQRSEVRDQRSEVRGQ